MSQRPILDDFSIEDIKKFIHDCSGKLIRVAKMMHCSHQTVYDLVDIYPELKEAKDKALTAYRYRAVEVGEDVLDILMDRVETAPDLAAKQAQYILSNSPHSIYKKDKEDKEDIKLCPALLAQLAKQALNDKS